MNECSKKRDLDGIYFRIERDACEVTTASAYDLLSDEDREAIAWVREHGGLDMAASRFESGEIAADMLWGKGHGRFWTTDEFEEEISKRLMPAGCEWPRFEDGELVKLGDVIVPSEGGEPREVYCINHFKDYWLFGLVGASYEMLKYGERVKRPTVLAADGEPLEVGQTVYAPHYDYVKCTVLAIEWVVDGYLVEVENEGGHKFRQTPDEFIHQRPEPSDSWERIEEDASLAPGDYIKKCGRKTDLYAYQEMPIDLVRRCRALAERERGE